MDTALVGHIYLAHNYELEVLKVRDTRIDNTFVRIVGNDSSKGIWLTFLDSWDYQRPSYANINKEYVSQLERWDD